jgi:thioredoxin-like negative regulator of GroEL
MGKMNIRKVNGQQLKGLLAGEKGRFIALFTASWCNFCRILINEIEAAKPDFAFVEVDISKEDDSWDEFDVSAVPTALLFEDGKEIARRPPMSEGLRLKDLRDLADRRSG